MPEIIDARRAAKIVLSRDRRVPSATDIVAQQLPRVGSTKVPGSQAQRPTETGVRIVIAMAVLVVAHHHDQIHSIPFSIPAAGAPQKGSLIMEVDPESATIDENLDGGAAAAGPRRPPHFLQPRPDQGVHHRAEQSVLHAVDLTRFPYRLHAIDVPEPGCSEDLVVSEDNRTWFLTCMGSSTVIMGDAVTDRPTKVRTGAGRRSPVQYPPGCDSQQDQPRVDHQHGQAGHPSEAGDSVTVIEASTGAVLSMHRVSSQTGSLEIPHRSKVMFSPNATPPWCTSRT